MNKRHDDIAFENMQAKAQELCLLTKIDNEATTRLRAIDTILFDVLNWDRSEVEAEKYCRTEGYADYVFSINHKPGLVLEAKKSGIDFLIPSRTFDNRPYAFGLLAKECKEAANAFQQVMGYASTLGARNIGISNGHQWIFGLTFVQGQQLENRLVYVFESLDAILKRFGKFYICFSRIDLEHNSAHKELVEALKLPAPAKLSSFIPGYPVSATRNIFQNELSYILDYVWQVTSQEEGTPAFIENCYVNPSAHEDILSFARELIGKRKTEDEILSHYEFKTTDRLPYELAHLPAEKPFVVLGEIGRGKSSFLKYLRFVAAKDLLEKYIQIDINFLDRPDNASQIPEYVYNEIERQLLENYSINVNENNFVRGVLHSDLVRLQKTPKGIFYAEDAQKYKEYELVEIEKIITDKHLYFTKLFHHLKKGRGCSLALFFDNLDRRNSEIQEQAFLKASSIARDWTSLVFLCLRPQTFYNSQQSGILDTIAPTTFTVGQPDLSLILKKRFAYARSIAEGQKFDEKIIRGAESKEIVLDLPSVAALFKDCEFSAWKHRGIIPTLEAVSNGNIRLLLDYAREILCSGHLDTKKILNRIRETGHYYIPDFEGVKALLYGDYMQYDPSKSPFINLFDIQSADAAEHFLKISILHYLARIPADSPMHGYIRANELTSYLSTIGYSYTVSMQAIEMLIEKQCITKKAIDMESNITDWDNLRITSLGKYHIHLLARMFQYIDAAIIDTPILDQKIKNQIKDESDIHKRIERTILFIEYLNNASEYVDSEEIKSVWKEIASELSDEIKDIRDRQRMNNGDSPLFSGLVVKN